MVSGGAGVLTGAESVVRGRVVSANASLDDGVVSIDGERIATVLSFPEWRAAHPDSPEPRFAGTLLPGLVDIHNHGGFGHRFDTVDAAQARAAARFHHASGSTTVVASIVTAAAADMVEQTAVLRELATEELLGGVHAEGPFLSEARCGAQDPRYLRDPDLELTDRLLTAADGQLRMMTLAPERAGYDAVAQRLTDNGVVVALGHSNADYASFRKALRPTGVGTVVTHLANGLPPLHHREPGPVAAGLVAAAAGHATVELIGDGVHVDPGFAALVFATAPGRVALITDAMQAAGLSDGEYRLGPQSVTVRHGVARIANGSIAGGVSTLLDCVARAVRESGVPLADAVRAATATPAAALRLPEVGDLRAGYFADLLIVDESLRLRRVLRRGEWLS
ncbi:N-acetylglucosamine 6-phosphate deacetylase [Nocardia tenerifensis]|uniref:N-acetylglucosamine 6-phosphate deacetylase n=1 Tax=Nocardia tenerifensis TaxID=228006 RepID=A0A318K2P2_9NOCA|nr:amidohydrolase family protein [Nocardia tenerifensis]PXX65120.1 N-acetylglucosamine 6-phosphate deacetylase [Nocardia tenerifensis]